MCFAVFNSVRVFTRSFSLIKLFGYCVKVQRVAWLGLCMANTCGTTATECATTKYVKDNKCLDCPSGSTCDGTKATDGDVCVSMDSNMHKTHLFMYVLIRLRAG